MEKKIQALRRFFNHRPPSVARYKEIRKTKTVRQCKNILRVIGRLAIGYWEELPREYKEFVTGWMQSCRDEYTEYLVHHTPIGRNRIRLEYKGLFISWIILLITFRIIPRISFMHIASNFVLMFDLNLKAKSLRTYLHKKNIRLKELLQLLGLLHIDEEMVQIQPN